jgi:pimeloyl-ACP methyl ester carboxylesterase
MFFRLFTVLLSIFLFSGCIREAKSPIDTIYYDNPSGAGRTLFVILPGIGDRPGNYEKNGFVGSVRKKGLPVDIVEVDAHYAYYEERNLLVRLREDVIGPAKAGGYDQIWIIGVSLGGMGALLYVSEYPGDITGLALFAPYLGEDELIGEIYRAGGLAGWNPGVLSENDWWRFLWLWLKENQMKPDALPLYLGYGRSDPFADAHELLGEILPPDRVTVIKGWHDRKTLRSLLEIFIEKWESGFTT